MAPGRGGFKNGRGGGYKPHYPPKHTSNPGRLQQRQEDDQPNLDEGRSLRPMSYHIGRKEPEPAPPRVASSSAPSTSGLHQRYAGPQWSKVPKGPAAMHRPAKHKPRKVSSNSRVSAAPPARSKPGGPSAASSVVASAAPDHRLHGQGQRAPTSTQLGRTTSEIPQSSRTSTSTSATVPVSASAGSEASRPRGKIWVDDEGEVWRSPGQSTSSSTATASTYIENPPQASLPSPADLLAAVKRVEAPSSGPSRRPSHSLPVRPPPRIAGGTTFLNSGSRSSLPSGLHSSTLPNRLAQPQPASHQTRPVAGPSKPTTQTGPSSASAPRPDAASSGTSHPQPHQTRPKTPPKQPATASSSLFRPASHSPTEVKAEAQSSPLKQSGTSITQPPIPSSTTRATDGPATAQAENGKGKQKSTESQWEVISITDSEEEGEEIVESDPSLRTEQPGRTAMSSGTAATSSKSQPRKHIYHFSEALWNFIKEKPGYETQLKTFELDREQKRLADAGYDMKVTLGNRKWAEIESWPNQERNPGAAEPFIGDADFTGVLHIVYPHNCTSYYRIHGHPPSKEEQALEKQAAINKSGRTDDGHFLTPAIKDTGQTVFEMRKLKRKGGASADNSASNSTTGSPALSRPPTSSAKAPETVRKGLRRYMYHFSLAFTKHDYGSYNYMPLLRDYELDFEKDRLRRLGYDMQAEIGDDSVAVESWPISPSSDTPLQSLVFHDSDQSWHQYYPRISDSRYVRKEYSQKLPRHERLERANEYLRELKTRWQDVSIAVLGGEYTVFEVSAAKPPASRAAIKQTQAAADRESATAPAAAQATTQPPASRQLPTPVSIPPIDESGNMGPPMPRLPAARPASSNTSRAASTSASASGSTSSGAPVASVTPATAPMQPAAQFSLTSVFELPLECQDTQRGVTGAVSQQRKIAFVHSKYEALELSHGRPIYAVEEGEIFSAKTVRLIYEAPETPANHMILPLPDDCRKSASLDQQPWKANRERFKLASIVAETLKGNIPTDSQFSHAYLILSLDSPARDAEPAGISGIRNDQDLPQVKPEPQSPPSYDLPLENVVLPRSPVFPYNIKASYSDTPHTRANAERFLDHFLQRYETTRSRLIDYYTISASFGYTVSTGTFIPNGTLPKRETISAYGQYGITNTLRKIPACTHQRKDGKLIFDAIRVGGANKGPLAYCDLFVTVHGELTEFESGQKRSFDRTFYLKSVENPAGFPYLIQSDSLVVRPWSDCKAWEADSLPVAPPPSSSTSLVPASVPRQTFQRERTIFMPPPQVSTSAFIRAISELPRDMRNLDMVAQATARSTASANVSSMTQKTLGKRRQAATHDREDSSDEEPDLTVPTSESRRVKPRLGEEQGNTPEADELRRLHERVKKLEGRLEDAGRVSESARIGSRKASPVPSRSETTRSTERPKTKADRKREKREEKEHLIRQKQQNKLKSADQPKSKKAKLGDTGNETSSVAPPLASTSESRPLATTLTASNSRKTKKPAIQAPPPFTPGESWSQEHDMWNRASAAKSKARYMLEARDLEGYLAVNMGGDVHYWPRWQDNKTASQLAGLPEPEQEDALSVHGNACAWSSDRKLLAIGFSQGSATTSASRVGRQFQVAIVPVDLSNVAPYANAEQAVLPYWLLDKQPHKGAGVTALSLMGEGTDARIVTAGSDGQLGIWNLPEDEDDLDVPCSLFTTNHTASVRRILTFTEGAGGPMALVAGADKRVSLLSFSGSSKKQPIVREWKEMTLVHQVYMQPNQYNLAVLCLAASREQFKMVDLRMQEQRGVNVFGARTEKDTTLGQYFHGDFSENNLFAYAFDDAVRIWDIRNTSKPYDLKAGSSGIIQPHFEDSTNMSFLEKKHFTHQKFQCSS